MPDREKVIKSLKWFRDRDSWREGISIYDDNTKMRKRICDNALALLKEQEPMKVTVRFNHTDNKCFDHYKCPSCGSTDIYYEQHYCDDCGKALDWSEIT